MVSASVKLGGWLGERVPGKERDRWGGAAGEAFSAFLWGVRVEYTCGSAGVRPMQQLTLGRKTSNWGVTPLFTARCRMVRGQVSLFGDSRCRREAFKFHFRKCLIVRWLLVRL